MAQLGYEWTWTNNVDDGNSTLHLLTPVLPAVRHAPPPAGVEGPGPKVFFNQVRSTSPSSTVKVIIRQASFRCR